MTFNSQTLMPSKDTSTITTAFTFRNNNDLDFYVEYINEETTERKCANLVILQL